MGNGSPTCKSGMKLQNSFAQSPSLYRWETEAPSEDVARPWSHGKTETKPGPKPCLQEPQPCAFFLL